MVVRATIQPLGIGVTIKEPTLNMVLNIAVTPLVVAVTVLTPDSYLAMTPLAVTATLVTPGVSLGAGATPKTVAVTIVTPTVNLV